MLIEMNATNEAEAKIEAVKISNDNPGAYVLVVNDFGLLATAHKALPAQAPSDACFGWYARNGKVRSFTEAQHATNQKATPALS